jgi:hypothetical protein
MGRRPTAQRRPFDVAGTFSLEDIVAAQRLFLTKQHVGKIVLRVEFG